MLEEPNPSGLCACGCGRATATARQSATALGYVRGKPVRYIRGHNNRKPRPECACGCGREVNTPKQRWIKGHNKKVPPPVTDENGCWIWQGADHGRPKLGGNANRKIAYRAFYEREVGPIPEGHHLHHICGVGRCVNPDHLVPMTPAEHSRVHASS